MANDTSSTALADRGELIDGTLKTVKGINFISFYHLEIFIVGVSAIIASFHVFLLCLIQNEARLVPRGDEMFESAIPHLTLIIELLGVGVILLGIIYGGIAFFRSLMRKEADSYEKLRHKLGKSILLGLELLVAGDIINTVAVEPTMESVLVLGGIVLIRTFLSFSLEIELEGNLPWRRHKTPKAPPTN
jgi:uncharacterized membrane protein